MTKSDEILNKFSEFEFRLNAMQEELNNFFTLVPISNKEFHSWLHNTCHNLANAVTALEYTSKALIPEGTDISNIRL